MDISALLSVINSIIKVSESLQHRLESIIQEDNYPKKHILLNEGQIERKIYFIKKGFARAFYYKDGKEYTSWFLGENDIMISIYSFYTRQPAIETIELLDDSILQFMSYDKLQELYKDFIEFNIVGRIVTELYYTKAEERAHNLRTLSAKERYDQLLKSYPEIIQKVEIKQIASHLGISPETLSRIRAQKNKS